MNDGNIIIFFFFLYSFIFLNLIYCLVNVIVLLVLKDFYVLDWFGWVGMVGIGV